MFSRRDTYIVLTAAALEPTSWAATASSPCSTEVPPTCADVPARVEYTPHTGGIGALGPVGCLAATLHAANRLQQARRADELVYLNKVMSQRLVMAKRASMDNV
ncbi:hypothetical protein GGR57DRAFT_459490 [Xylariaceae sp. FL1272]|nr:hypothetical protein GGR57DRAFT_459490 [Xylariaceae sp. FL1272]